MQKTIFFLFFFFSSLNYAQTTTLEPSSESIYFEIDKIPDYDILKKKIDLKQVVTKADTLPEFPDGMNAFKKKYFENIETLNLKHNEKLDTRLYFVVEKNGYVRNIAAVGKNKKHAEAAETGIKRIFTRWKPAKLNGEAVRYLFYFPLTSKEYQ